MKKGTRKSTRYAEERRRFLILHAASLFAAAAGGLLRKTGLSWGHSPPQGREARFYRRIGRGKKQ